MTLNLQKPDITELKPRITVFGVGGGGGNAVNNMITSGLDGVEFVVANTDAQALMTSRAERCIQMGVNVTEGLGAGSQPEVGEAAAQECIDEIRDHLSGTHMAFVTAGMGGGTGTGAAPVVAAAAREMNILTVGVVTKPFAFEGQRRMKLAEKGIEELQACVDTLIVIPNQNLFRIANDKTTFAEAFSMADQVLNSGVSCITDLMVKEGLINLDFADVRSVMAEMGRAMMGTGEATGDGRAMAAAEAAISNPLLDETSMAGAQGLLISITGGKDMTLFEVDEAATRIREEVDVDANIIMGATFDDALEGTIRVSVVATGINMAASGAALPDTRRMNEAAERLRQSATARTQGDAPALPAAAQAMADPVPAASAPHAAPAAMDAAPAPVQRPVVQTAQHAQALVERELQIENAPAKPSISASTNSAIDDFSDADFQSALDEQIRQPAPQAVPFAPEPATNGARSSSVQELPIVAQREVRNETPNSHEESGAMGLLKRLTSGLGGSETNAPAAVAPSAPAARAPQEAAAPVASPRQAGLDQHGRPAATQRPISEEDQLDIPAFLRRQAN